MELRTAVYLIFAHFITLCVNSEISSEYVTLSKQMESRILKVLGLKERPRPGPNATAPQYMLDLYKRLQGDTSYMPSEAQRCSFSDPSIPGNIIRSFANSGKDNFLSSFIWQNKT